MQSAGVYKVLNYYLILIFWQNVKSMQIFSQGVEEDWKHTSGLHVDFRMICLPLLFIFSTSSVLRHSQRQ